MANDYGTGLGSKIRQHRAEVAGLTGVPYEEDILEKWKAGGAITPEEQLKMAQMLASVIKYGKGVYKGAMAMAAPKTLQAPTVPTGIAGKAAGTVFGLAKSPAKARNALTRANGGGGATAPATGNGAEQKGLQKAAENTAKLADAFYRKLTGQTTEQTAGRAKLPPVGTTTEKKFATAE